MYTFFFILIFVTQMLYSQDLVPESAEKNLDFNKINGSSVVEKPLFANIETNMKIMEDNILKLMRELGELKMQVQEIKTKIKKEMDDYQNIIDRQKRDLDAALKKDIVSSVDMTSTSTSSGLDQLITTSEQKQDQPSLQPSDVVPVQVETDVSATQTSQN